MRKKIELTQFFVGKFRVKLRQIHLPILKNSIHNVCERFYTGKSHKSRYNPLALYASFWITVVDRILTEKIYRRCLLVDAADWLIFEIRARGTVRQAPLGLR